MKLRGSGSRVLTSVSEAGLGPVAPRRGGRGRRSLRRREGVGTSLPFPGVSLEEVLRSRALERSSSEREGEEVGGGLGTGGLSRLVVCQGFESGGGDVPLCLRVW